MTVRIIFNSLKIIIICRRSWRFNDDRMIGIQICRSCTNLNILLFQYRIFILLHILLDWLRSAPTSAWTPLVINRQGYWVLNLHTTAHARPLNIIHHNYLLVLRGRCIAGIYHSSLSHSCTDTLWHDYSLSSDCCPAIIYWIVLTAWWICDGLGATWRLRRFNGIEFLLLLWCTFLIIDYAC